MNHYQILGLRENANEAEIKRAYRNLAKKYHPDVSKEPDAQERFVKISMAYEALTNPQEYSYNESDIFTEAPTVDREAARRQRAYDYAQMSYAKFKKNNAAFQDSWYFPLVKYGIYVLVGVIYTIAVGLLLMPFIGWWMTGQILYLFILIIPAVASVQLYRLGNELWKESKPYLEE